ncbi:DUF724 domain-containing protein 7-like isoform X1 [Nicotiana tomentosiformis]|uniref:DUF724 domain-containing protein 7-like isoform X1 n=1 Tax=Nicotiana tomentosiformis TaxID=4098 RepID=UPI00051B4D98|nr:DUF724 domain-containing protein 7-like isoform X1 [Nicotiana tomentosiformis]
MLTNEDIVLRRLQKTKEQRLADRNSRRRTRYAQMTPERKQSFLLQLQAKRAGAKRRRFSHLSSNAPFSAEIDTRPQKQSALPIVDPSLATEEGPDSAATNIPITVDEENNMNDCSSILGVRESKNNTSNIPTITIPVSGSGSASGAFGKVSTPAVTADRSASSTAAVQPFVGTNIQLPNGMLDGELNSITTPERSPALPFKKNSNLWEVFESMNEFAKLPQSPHFSPLAQYEEEKREEAALQQMIKYVLIVEKILELAIAELSNSTLINDMLASFKDLEEYGFDVMPIKRHLNDLLLENEKKAQLRRKLEEVEVRIRNHNLKKVKTENEIDKIGMKLKDLEKELMSAKNVKEAKDHDIMVLSSERGAICDDIRHLQLDNERILASMKQT